MVSVQWEILCRIPVRTTSRHDKHQNAQKRKRIQRIYPIQDKKPLRHHTVLCVQWKNLARDAVVVVRFPRFLPHAGFSPCDVRTLAKDAQKVVKASAIQIRHDMIIHYILQVRTQCLMYRHHTNRARALRVLDFFPIKLIWRTWSGILWVIRSTVNHVYASVLVMSGRHLHGLSCIGPSP